MKIIPCLTLVLSIGLLGFSVSADGQTAAAKSVAQPNLVASKTSDQNEWTQWRGPNRDGTLQGIELPESLSDSDLKQVWSVKLGPSYSGALVVGDRIFVTETKDSKEEVVTALDRKTGQVVWTTKWTGSMRVPFFAASNGSWIRSTPAFSDGKLYVAGMKDVLVCLNAANGSELWKVDFPKQTGSANPNFGFVCSPLVDGGHVYVQAGGAFTKLDKNTGNIIWQGVKDGGGMNGSAFSSPVIATIGGQRQAVLQTRTSLCGVDLATGNQIWTIEVPTFRGMNILTPTIVGNDVFTSTYGGTTQLINVQASNSGFSTTQKWKRPAEGYMSSPVIVDGHAYVHLRNTRFACFDLKDGTEKWRSEPFGKYASLVASGDKILALDERGELLLVRANPERFELIDRRTVGDDSWAHVAVSGNQIVVRNLKEVVLFERTK